MVELIKPTPRYFLCSQMGEHHTALETTSSGDMFDNNKEVFTIKPITRTNYYQRETPH